MKKHNTTQNRSCLAAPNDGFNGLFNLKAFFSLFFLLLVSSGAFAQSQQILGLYPVMDGGFEGQPTGALSGTGGSIATNTACSVWTMATSSFSAATITSSPGTGTTNARTGNKFINCAYASFGSGSGNHRRLISPTAASGAVTVGTYRVQFYYRQAAGSPSTGVVRGGASVDGTTGAVYGAISPLVTSTTWTKYQGSTSITGTPALGGGLIDAYVSSGSSAALKFDYDDFVIYSGTGADNANPDPVTAPNQVSAAATQQTIGWTAPGTGVDGGGYMVVRSTADPATAPNANGIYAVGNFVAGTEKVVYMGTSTSFIDNGLSASTPYYYRIYTVDKAYNYSTSVSLTASTSAPSFAAEPTVQASGASIGSMNATGSGFTINWTGGNGSYHVVLVKAGSDVDSDPADGNTYSDGAGVFGSGTQIGSSNFVVFSGTGSSVAVTGLAKGTTYYVKVYTFNGSGGSENYLITSPASGNKQTLGTITSNGSGGGPWATGTSWAGLVAPGQYDDVIVTGSDVINVGANAKCNNLTIGASAKVWATTAFTLAVYGTSLACDGTLGDASNTASQLTIQFANNLSINGAGNIYPYKINPVASTSNISITFDANTTITYGTVALAFENSSNDNVTYTVSASKTVTVAGALSTNGSQTGVGAGNETLKVYGTLSIGGTLNTTVASGKAFSLTVYSGGLIEVAKTTTGKAFNLIPSTAVQNASYTVNTGGELRVYGLVDCSSTSYTGSVTGGGTFSTAISGLVGAPANPTLTIINASGLDSSTGPIRTSTVTFDAGTSITYSGTSAQNTGDKLPATLNGLTINNAAGVTLSQSTTLNGTLTLTAGTLFVGSGNTLTLKGTRGGTGSIDGTAATINYAGTSASQTASTLVNVNNLVINNTASTTPGVSLGAATTVNGTLTMTAGAIFNSTNNLTLADGANIVCANGTFSTQAPVFGSSVNLTYNGATAKTSGFELPTSSTVLNNLTISNASGVALNADATVNGTLSLTSGTLSLGAKNLTIGATGSISGASSSNYIVTNGAGKLTQSVGASTAKLFPIGASASSSYDPATVTPTDATTISASVSSTLAYHNQAVPNSMYMNPREWTITPAAASSTVLALTPSATHLYYPGSYNAMSGGSQGYDNVEGNYYFSSATRSGTTFTATYSDFTNPFVTATTDVAVSASKNIVAKSSIYASNGQIFVENAAGKLIDIYSATGSKIRSVNSNANNATIALEKGIYIISVDNVKSKVLVK